ncbi:acyltransferase [Agromyces sp. Soil535]|uniref:acyltransferase family protein n=1 Tax=Agromyces sp. Soil535 TaxID=1736390 RepID=UPI000A5D986B|nr:acyltransferase [Agromyces sp. Soil535]
MAGSPTPVPRTTVRPEIQALRAVAVGAVVLHHGWPAVAPAGYMGVDVFFVVSGYLITALLIREVGRTGGISLGAFYLRRARRILPAAIAVLLAVSALTIAVVPQRDWADWFRESVASTLYYENWQLAADSQIPARADLESTPVQHFWSLSVEEQFYLVWPLLLIVAVVSARRRGRSIVRPMFVVLGFVTAASFVHSLLLTSADHNLAYFSTIARTWEFGAGGLLALLAITTPSKGREVLRTVASWCGLLLIAVPIVAFRDPEAFPGVWVLLPVAGTLAVIWAGTPATRWSTARVAGLRPVQWVGDVSYSLYLWHWPIFMFTPFLIGMPSPAWVMALLVVLSLLVAWLSKRLIEDPFRARRNPMPRRPAVLLGGLGFLVAAIVSTGFVAPSVAAEQQSTGHHAGERD